MMAPARLASLAFVAIALAGGVAHWCRPLAVPGTGTGTGTGVDTDTDIRRDTQVPAYAVGEALRAAVPPAAPDPAAREIGWQALLPSGWDPLAPFKGLKLDELEDGDPRAQIALYKARQYGKRAPVEPALDGAAVRIAGFVVSLDGEGEAIREFLLVPYFGACIHVPPPPANQVIHVRADRPLAGLRTMDTVWISGVLRIERADTIMGYAGYAMRAASVAAYLQPAAR